MKLLKFSNSDAPHTLADVQLRSNRLWFQGNRANVESAKGWSIEVAPASLQGGYWLLDDNNNPICEITDVLLAVPEAVTTTANGSSASSSSVASPRGVSEKEVDGVDFRSRMGRQLERERATYGATSKVASKSARSMINAEEVTEKKHDRMKRGREAVAEAIENNNLGVAEHNEGKRLRKGVK
ncbi:hypothetical protein ABL78_5719 [Leptomonas seymouri]|uniref:Uncharacterized protein n=1 Tax=Leptomonas seymouri TaxID=5684 RepID=A0A0N1IJ04_LEPSE|nr:hypothetical protein ABL78_5719 [Leptomonas seymouri]|eukprot:KPI85211.1 hypothetical protein ABL78_5719 [Leptomonas seymouri]